MLLIGEIHKFHACRCLRTTDPGDSALCFDPSAGIRELKTYLPQGIVRQTVHHHHRESALTDIKNDAAILVPQLYAGKPKWLTRMEPSLRSSSGLGGLNSVRHDVQSSSS